MFNCANCQKPANGSPIIVVGGYRMVSYENVRRLTDEVTGKTRNEVVNSEGKEIMSELRMCRECAPLFGIEVPKHRTTTLAFSKPQFEEPLAAAGKFSMARLAVAGLFKRKDHDTKRA